MFNESLPIAVIGAGPVGLAAAAHIVERGQTPIILESGETVGSSVLAWGHVRMFSPWLYNIDGAMQRMLEANGWQHPPTNELPSGFDLVDKLLRPFSELPLIAPHLHLNTRVVAISRLHSDKMKDKERTQQPFLLHMIDANGNEATIQARAVIDASGTWNNANPIGANGLYAIGEKRHAERIVYGIPNILGEQRYRYADRSVMVVGGGHSAINSLLDLAQLAEDAPKTEIIWVLRSEKSRHLNVGDANDALPARGQLSVRIREAVNKGIVTVVAPFLVREINGTDSVLNVIGDTPDGPRAIDVDEIIVATGSRPQLEILRELRIDLDPSLESARVLAPLIDPNLHSCGTVRPHGEAELRQPESHFYIVGMKSYGRAPTFLLATGYEQVRSVVAALSGDFDAARRVQLNLPETGVCNSRTPASESCCALESTVNKGLPLHRIVNIK